MYKNLANKVLTWVFILFLMAVVLKYYYRGFIGAELFYTTVSAALIGGIADWFAVTAIFKRPLGFPWHTALIPRHRDRVIVAVANLIERDLLTVESIKTRLDKVSFVKLFIEWADSESGRRFLRLLMVRHSQVLLDNVQPEAIANHFETLLKKGARQVMLTPHIKAFLEWLMAGGKDNALLDAIISEFIYLLENPNTQNVIYDYLERIKQEKTKSLVEKFFVWLGEQTDSVNLTEASEVLHAEMLLLLHELKNPEHVLRSWIHGKLFELTAQLEHDSTAGQAIEIWKEAVLNNIEVHNFLTSFAQSILQGLSMRSDSPIIIWVNNYIEQYWYTFRDNTWLQEWLEVQIKKAVYRLIDSEHHIIGRAVQRVLGSFTNRALSAFVEDKAGDDLQWIRVNGSIVGGLVGLLLFLFLRFAFDPYILPFLRTFLL